MGREIEDLKKEKAKKAASGVFSEEAGEKVSDVYLSRISPNPWQPRVEIDPDETMELAQSIDTYGLLQPVVLRKHQDGFQIVAGHRRIEAHLLLKKDTVKAIIRTVSDAEMKILVAIENIQRKDLDPIEIAIYLDTISKEEELDNKGLAGKLGISESKVSRYLALLNLSEDVILSVKSKLYTNLKVLNLLGKVKEAEQHDVLDLIIVRKYNTEDALAFLRETFFEKPKPKSDYIVKNQIATVVKKKGMTLLEINNKNMSEDQSALLATLIKSLNNCTVQ